MNEEIVYIEFLNKDKNFEHDAIEFGGKNAIEKAKEWGLANLDNFSRDMVKIRKI